MRGLGCRGNVGERHVLRRRLLCFCRFDLGVDHVEYPAIETMTECFRPTTHGNILGLN